MELNNREIQKDADDLLKGKLRELFRLNNLSLGENPSTEGEEKGIDFFFEVFNRDNSGHQFLFLNQNKGTDEPISVIKKDSHSSKGKISFQIEIRHAKYFYFELSEPLIFTLCDNRNKLIYWYSIQLDNTIPERIEKQITNEIPTLQIYLSPENILNQNNFSRFIQEIHFSRTTQIGKPKGSISFEADYSQISNLFSDMHIIDKVYKTLELFKLPVFPTSILRKIPTISGSYGKSYLTSSTLRTDNFEFFNLIEGIKLIDGNLIYEEGNKVENQQEKLKAILRFFKLNIIYHLQWNGKGTKERICVHELFVYDDCDCERCNYDKLNFKRSREILNNSPKENSSLENLRKGYTYYLLGDLKNSIKVFIELNKVSYSENDPIYYIVTKYNLEHLKRFLSYNYFENDKGEILKELNGFYYELDEIFVAQYAPYFIDFHNLFKNNAYFENSFKNVDNKLIEIQRISYQDKLGARFSNSKVEELRTDFLRALTFLEFNYVVFNNFHEYTVLTNKVLEGFVALYTLKNKSSSKYMVFDMIIIRMWLFHVDFKQACHILKKYQLKSIKVNKGDDFCSNFEGYIQNLIDSMTDIKVSISNKNFLFGDKVELIVKNLILILSRVELKSKDINSLIEKLVVFVERIDMRTFFNDEAVNQLVVFQKNIKKENLKRIILLLKKYDYAYSSAFSKSIDLFTSKANENEVKDLMFHLFEVEKLGNHEIFLSNDYAEVIGLLFNGLSLQIRNNLKELITEELKLNFKPDYYYLYTIYDVIDFHEDLFDKFVLSVPDDTQKDERLKNFIGDSWYYNYRLEQLINLMYSFDIPFSDEIRELSKKTNYKSYYDWLMNLDDYDYEDFDIYWILKYKTDPYFKAFKKSKKLKSVIVKSLKESYIEGVARIYFTKLI